MAADIGLRLKQFCACVAGASMMVNGMILAKAPQRSRGQLLRRYRGPWRRGAMLNESIVPLFFKNVHLNKFIFQP